MSDLTTFKILVTIYFLLSDFVTPGRNKNFECGSYNFRYCIFQTFEETSADTVAFIEPKEAISDISADIQYLRNDKPDNFLSIVTYSNISQLKGFLHVQSQDQHHSILIYYIVALDMHNLLQVLYQIQDSGLLNNILKIMPIFYIECSQMFTNSTDIFQLKQDLSHLKYPLDSSIFIILNIKDETQIWELYLINNIYFIQKLSLGKEYFNQISLRRQNFQGAIIRVTGVDDEENQNIVSYKKDSKPLEFNTGSSVSLLFDLRDSLNFSVQAMKDDNYIFELPNGTLGGIGKQLQNGEADLAIPLSYILPYRRKNLTSLHPLCVDRILVFFKQPQASSVRNIFFQPFSTELWGVLSSVWFILLISIFVYNLVAEGYLEQKTNFEQPILWTIALQCQQGWHACITTNSGRIIHFCGLWTGLIPFIAYCASIISALTAPILPIRSFSELRKMNYVLLADPVIHYGTFLADENNPAEEITKILEQNFIDETDSVRKVFQGGHAFINTLDFFSPLSWSLGYKDHQICDSISWVPFDSVILSNAFYVNKDSPLKETFNLRILFSLERGLNTRYINNLYKETRVHCVRRQKSFQEQLGFPDVFTAFAILYIGIASAIICLLVEKLYFWRSRRTIYRK